VPQDPLNKSVGSVKFPEHRVPGEDMHAQFRADLFGWHCACKCIERLDGIRSVLPGGQGGMDNSYDLGSACGCERSRQPISQVLRCLHGVVA
jgi:hypothetical protein